MRTCVLINSGAGPSTSNEPLLNALRDRRGFEIRELTPGDDWAAVFGSVLKEKFDRIVVAGGDGTVHSVAGAMLEHNSSLTLGIVPLGTGNDFCRTLAIPSDPIAALDLLDSGRVRSLDAIRLTGDLTGHVVNAATGGFSGQVAAETTSEIKESWGPLAYLRGALGPLTNLPAFPLNIRIDGGAAERIDALNIVVANARAAAGGVLVAPAANPEDGLLDLVIVRHSESLDLTLLASRLMHGNYTDDENVVHRRAKRIDIESDAAIPFSVDGERCEGRRFTFEVIPAALRVVVGPEYVPDLGPEPAIEEERPSVAKSPRERVFGLIAGLLLVVKRLKSGSGLAVLGMLLALVLIAWLTRGAAAGTWREWNESKLALVRENATESSDRCARVVTWFGGGWGTAVVVSGAIGLLLRSGHYLSAGTFLAVVIGVLVMEAVLKPFFALARPAMNGDLITAGGYSFPSGHALRGVGIYGAFAAYFAALAWERPAWWFAAVLSAAWGVAICWSRVYLGVHWPMDVITGGLLAATWLAACLLARHRVRMRSLKTGSGARITMGES